jgi:hypothetical protein
LQSTCPVGRVAELGSFGKTRMKSRLFKIATFVSAVLAASTLLLWIATFFVTPWDHRLSLTRNFHVGVWNGVNGDTLGRLVVFNNADYGPYRGSMMGSVERRVASGDTLGVYYRYFRTPDGSTLWTLMVSLWYPLLIFGILPAAWLVQRRRARTKHDQLAEQLHAGDAGLRPL